VRREIFMRTRRGRRRTPQSNLDDEISVTNMLHNNSHQLENLHR
jgi:hypothetical protein